MALRINTQYFTYLFDRCNVDVPIVNVCEKNALHLHIILLTTVRFFFYSKL